jgi:hypothetical protein
MIDKNVSENMQFVDAVIGNSSSGIIEVPSFRIGTIKYRRQAEKEGLRQRKLYSEDFQRVLKSVVNPYGDGRTAERILKILKSYDKLIL